MNALPLVHNPGYVVPLPEGHRFPMPKFNQVQAVLLSDGVATLQQFHCPDLAAIALIEQVHTPDYVQAYCEGTLDKKAMRRIGLPWSPYLVTRTRTAIGGTLLTAQLALKYGLACNTAGGTHHAFPAFGSGFCIFNDLAIAARTLFNEGQVDRVLIVDLDVHQGDGTAFIFQDDPAVFTFSMHCESNFPFRKQQSDLDVPLPDGMADAAYLRTLQTYLPDLLGEVKPDIVLYDAGVDPHHADRLGRLSLTDAGLYQRDYYVLDTCLKAGIPVGTVIGGGYGKDMLELARRHALVHRAATDLYARI